ncbi:MAG TPA: DUF6714 family protein [Steroidobacter sp.]|uniref:DUF6714 family protein n=1 Tax=Steroidobacter sp. TaxID=1978227 RepID=UPI002EDB9994
MKYPSPADIEEMKARGYDRSTIESAMELSKRWHEAEAIRDAIKAAFAGVKLGGGVGLRQAQAIDGYEDDETCAACREQDEKEDWSRITVELLDECNSSLSFFDDEGMRFHLPAYLIADLNGQYSYGMAYTLTQSSQLNEQCWLLNDQQRAAVRRYLEFIADEPEYAGDRAHIKAALESFWSD